MMTMMMAAVVDSASFLAHEIMLNFQTYNDILVLLGLIYASKFTVKSAWALYQAMKTFVFSKVGKNYDLVKRYGSWAIVTGCTDGIGKAYSIELAKRGVNIILISRSMDKLQICAEELEKCHHVKTHIIQADFGQGRDIYVRIASEIGDREVGILVNNVGVMLDHPMLFEEVTEKDIWSHIYVNVASLTMMTHTILPQMLKRGKGAIVNLSSSSALQPLPLMSVYSATKAYVDFFSQALSHEYADKGIVVQTLVPFYIATNMTSFSPDLQKSNFVVPTATRFAQNAICTLGHSNHTTGYWVFGIEDTFGRSVPRWLWLRGSVLLQKFLIRKTSRSQQEKMKEEIPFITRSFNSAS